MQGLKLVNVSKRGHKEFSDQVTISYLNDVQMVILIV